MRAFLRVMLTVFAITLMASLGLGLILPTVDASRQDAPTPATTAPSPTPIATQQTAEPTATAPQPTVTTPSETRLTWERIGGLAGFCEQLAIDSSNRASGGACGGDRWQASLTTEELRQYFTYLARYQPFTFEVSDNAGGPDNMTIRVEFSGRGTRIPTDQESLEVAQWAASVHARLLEQSQRERASAAALDLLAREGGLARDSIAVLSVQPVTWRDACLEIQGANQACALVETPGYLVQLSADGRTYRVHTNREGLARLAPEAAATSTPTPTQQPTRAPLPTPTRAPTSAPSPTPWPTPWPVTITDWRGEYWSNDRLEGAPALVRNDNAVSADWGYNAPASGLSSDHFSARWSRKVRFSTGDYRFILRADDGVRLWVAGNLLIDRWHGGYTEDSVLQHIWEGEHEVVVEYFELEGIAKVHLAWEKQQPKPTPTLSPNLWKAEYFERRSPGNEPKVVRNETKIDFDWGESSPSKQIRSDQFSARYTRKLAFAEGTYRLRALADDGVRVWVDDELVIDAWQDQIRTWHEAVIKLQGEHHLRIEYFENTGGAALSFAWQRIGP
jgi:hypothetical protein